MPKISQTNEIDISPEKYLKACSPTELMEVELLIMSPRFQTQMNGFEKGSYKPVVPEIPQLAATGTYYCSICGKVPVDVDNGIDTCDKCL